MSSGTEICTLEEAAGKGLFEISEIEHFTQHINLLYDVNSDNTLDMNDVVMIQRIAAKLQRADEYHYKYIVNHKSDMEAVVKVQQYVAKLITDLA